MNKTKKSFFAVAVVMVLAIGVNAPVSAAESTRAEIMDALSNVTGGSKAATTSVLTNAGQFKETLEGSTAFISKYEGTEVRLPKSAADSIEFLTSKGSKFGITLPFSSSAAAPEQIANGIVAYDNKNATATVPIAKTDGSLQLTTVIENQKAPSNFEYQFTLPKGSKILTLGDGLALMDGMKFLGAISAPWAKDANGRDVPTHYEILGTTITQVVDHFSQRFAYPIVADPWLGTNLFSSVYLAPKLTEGEPVVNLNLSVWGWMVYLGTIPGPFPYTLGWGQTVLNTSGWDEAWSQSSSIRAALDKPSQRQQFECHALGAIAAGEWNLEKFRVNRWLGNWRIGVVGHHCNWVTANGF
jgi:hypothetical protein